MRECAIITPVYNEKKGIKDTLSYLEYLANLGFNVNLVDDCSTDGTREIVGNYAKSNNSKINTYFMEENGKKVGAVKEVLKKLDPDVEYVMLLDANSVYKDPKKIPKVIETMENEGIDAGAFKIRPYEMRKLSQALQNIEWTVYDFSKDLRSRKGKSFLLPGGCTICRKDVIEETLEEQKERFGGEDLETTLIMQRKGYKTRFFPEVEVRKKVPETFKEWHEQRNNWRDGQMKVLKSKTSSFLDFLKESGNYYLF